MSAPTPADPLELIAELSSAFASSGDTETTLQRAIERITGYVGAEGGALFLLEDGGRELVCHACTGPVKLTGLRVASDQGIVGRCSQTDRMQRVRDVREDPSWNPDVDADTGFTTRSILCAPLQVQGRRLGAIELVNKTSGALFDEADERLLGALASSAALALHNAQITERLVERERLAREVDLAAEIQRSMLPAPRPAPFPLVGVNLPARGVSGDFYDWLERPDGSIAFCVADVSGKGINAAILMAKTASLFRCIARDGTAPGALLGRLNDEILETATRGMFVTMAAGVLDPVGDRIVLANAGHPPALFRSRQGGYREIASGGPPLGITPLAETGGDPPEVTLFLDGGSLHLFTDGVTESRAADGTMLGTDGLRREIDRLVEQGPRALTDGLLARLASARPRDDLTLLVVQGRMDPMGGALEPLLAHRLVARPGRLSAAREAVAQACRTAGGSEPFTRDVVLAVDEACQNVIRHAYGGDPEGELVLELLRDGDDLVVYLRDFAPRVDPGEIHPRELEDLRPGGLGTHFIRELMDAHEFLAPESGPGNVLRMRKRIA